MRQRGITFTGFLLPLSPCQGREGSLYLIRLPRIERETVRTALEVAFLTALSVMAFVLVVLDFLPETLLPMMEPMEVAKTPMTAVAMPESTLPMSVFLALTFFSSFFGLAASASTWA